MPYCTSCGDRFEGRGIYCGYHGAKTYGRGYEQPNAYYTPDSNPNVHYRTGHRQRHDDLTHSASLSLFPSPLSTSASLQQAASQFRNLADEYAINHMTFHTHANGTKSVQVSANKDRCQCTVCKDWFPDRRRLEQHQWEQQGGCEIHELCFPSNDEHFHGTTYRHDRCFVRGCVSIYRREGGWKTSVIETHIREWHQ
ncbi:hypothetical protein EJ04DRAFT_503174 [Polyplosphaeria fusca]|uniref:Uncharacterized protein n=1 Tax=Polyplosphaeria fusca TaxID=682080 RepID=A0A9P4QP75_9PLEO|nr:hypothetical protein EJ04DRAFT_503174 [Polyplosphaeria fusca]